MNPNRRKFLQISALLGAGASLLPLQFCAAPKKEEALAASSKLDRFGIQLYAVKEDMALDPQETIRTLASYGYKQLEGFDGGKGILWGMEPPAFKQMLTELDIRMVATHCNVFENLEQQAQQAAEVGISYLICPWIGGLTSLDEYKKMAAKFNAIGEQLKPYGLKFAYHNHDYSFVELEGKIPQDLLLEETDPALVDFEMDMFWVHVAGTSPSDYLAKYPGRFRLCHLKDAAAGQGDPHTRGVELGQGEMPYAELVKKSQELGMEYFIVEQEHFPTGTPLEAAKANAAYLSTLTF